MRREESTSTEIELIAIEQINAIELFASEKVDPLLKGIAEKAKAHVPDLSTDKGRKAIASMGYKVAQSKTALDKLRTDLVAGKKAEIKKVDDSGKYMRDCLDYLKAEVTQPLTEWKAEEAKRIETERLAEEARIEDERVAKEEKERIEKKRIDDELEAKRLELEEREAKAVRTQEIQGKINAIRGYMIIVDPDTNENYTLDKLILQMSKLDELVPDESFGDLHEEAISAWNTSVHFLDHCITDKQEAEAKRQIERDEQLQKEAAETAREEERKKAEREKKKVLEREAKAKIAKDDATRKLKEAEERGIQREKEIKDNAAISRHEMLKAIGVNLDITTCREMEESTWNEFYNNKNSEYQAEQNRIWVEEQKGKRDQEKKEAAELAEKEKADAIKETQRIAQEEADQKEVKRLEDERIEKEKREAEAADIEHRTLFNREILEDLIPLLVETDGLGDPQEAAKVIIKKLVNGRVRHISVNY